MAAILLTINLQGRINGSVKHTDKQEVKVNVSKSNDKFPKFLTKRITHSDRGNSICVQKLKIEENVVNKWQSNECPHWEKSNKWKNMTKKQRIESYINRFDEGYGVSYQ